MKPPDEYGVIFNIQKFSLNDGPGIRTVIFFKGCPLRCPWCANPESQEPQVQILWDKQKCVGCHTCVESCPSSAIRDIDSNIVIDHRRCSGSSTCSENCTCVEKCPAHALKVEGELKSVDEIVRVVMQDEPFYEESGGGVTLSGGEAAMQPDFAIALLKVLKERKVHTAMETTGFASKDVFQRILPYLDLLLYDIKHWDEEKHQKSTKVSNLPILANMKYAIDQGKEVLPRLPVIPGFNNSIEDALGFVGRLKEVGAKRVQLLPFHQFGENKYQMLGKEYPFAKVKALYPEDLQEFKQVFLDNGIEAFL